MNRAEHWTVVAEGNRAPAQFRAINKRTGQQGPLRETPARAMDDMVAFARGEAVQP